MQLQRPAPKHMHDSKVLQSYMRNCVFKQQKRPVLSDHAAEGERGSFEKTFPLWVEPRRLRSYTMSCTVLPGESEDISTHF